MLHSTDRQAVLLFVRDEQREALLKPLHARYRPMGYSALNRKIVERLAPLVGSGADLLVVHESATGEPDEIVQRGDGFGERIANALNDAFSAGYENVAIIGNDCPTITPDDITAAFSALQSGACIVGAPAYDGGAYLVAARKGAVQLDEFRALPWRTPQLFTALLLLPGAISVSVARPDFDSWNSGKALQALVALLGYPSVSSGIVIPAIPFTYGKALKARTRCSLPSPPVFL